MIKKGKKEGRRAKPRRARKLQKAEREGKEKWFFRIGRWTVAGRVTQ